MHRPTPLPRVLSLAVLFAAPACAGGQGDGPAPPSDSPAAGAAQFSDVQQRADRGHERAEGFEIAQAQPGTRITSGNFSGILWHPDGTARGTYEIIATIEVLPGSRKTEGYGIFLGGRDLESDAQRYTYFLLRDDGRYLVKTRNGSETSTVIDWTASDAITTLPDEPAGASRATNIVVLRVTDDAIAMLINGRQVFQQLRGDLPLDGMVGMRINHGLVLQVHSFDLGGPGMPAE
jgi:hypothetical protein